MPNQKEIESYCALSMSDFINPNSPTDNFQHQNDLIARHISIERSTLEMGLNTPPHTIQTIDIPSLRQIIHLSSDSARSAPNQQSNSGNTMQQSSSNGVATREHQQGRHSRDFSPVSGDENSQEVPALRSSLMLSIANTLVTPIAAASLSLAGPSQGSSTNMENESVNTNKVVSQIDNEGTQDGESDTNEEQSASPTANGKRRCKRSPIQQSKKVKKSVERNVVVVAEESIQQASTSSTVNTSSVTNEQEETSFENCGPASVATDVCPSPTTNGTNSENNTLDQQGQQDAADSLTDNSVANGLENCLSEFDESFFNDIQQYFGGIKGCFTGYKRRIVEKWSEMERQYKAKIKLQAGKIVSQEIEIGGLDNGFRNECMLHSMAKKETAEQKKKFEALEKHLRKKLKDKGKKSREKIKRKDEELKSERESTALREKEMKETLEALKASLEKVEKEYDCERELHLKAKTAEAEHKLELEKLNIEHEKKFESREKELLNIIALKEKENKELMTQLSQNQDRITTLQEMVKFFEGNGIRLYDLLEKSIVVDETLISESKIMEVPDCMKGFFYMEIILSSIETNYMLPIIFPKLGKWLKQMRNSFPNGFKRITELLPPQSSAVQVDENIACDTGVSRQALSHELPSSSSAASSTTPPQPQPSSARTPSHGNNERDQENVMSSEIGTMPKRTTRKSWKEASDRDFGNEVNRRSLFIPMQIRSPGTKRHIPSKNYGRP